MHACVFRTCAASTGREEAGWSGGIYEGRVGEEEGGRATHTTKNVDVERSED